MHSPESNLPMLKKIRANLSKILPNLVVFNYLIAVSFFLKGNGRFPRRVESRKATLNDFIFNRMIRNDWNQLEKACVDKEYAKFIVKGMLGDEIKVPKTVEVIGVKRTTTVEELAKRLEPFWGQRLIAKPTGGSGGVLFLDKEVNSQNLSDFLEKSKKQHFFVARETQYLSIENRIIIEQNISGGENINDYKFFCSRGSVLYCQVDVDRFSGHKRAICELPEFRPLSVISGGHPIPEQLSKPKWLAQMIEISKKLSSHFDFVRVDLYDTEDGVYFGELTFSPGAAADSISDEGFSIEFLNKIKTALHIETANHE